mgnify:CR=1 FL=1
MIHLRGWIKNMRNNSTDDICQQKMMQKVGQPFRWTDYYVESFPGFREIVNFLRQQQQILDEIERRKRQRMLLLATRLKDIGLPRQDCLSWL